MFAYRYGFNGQEKSNEISGEGNSYTAEFWQYDSRIGRRWNLDPKPTIGISQYSAFNNNPMGFTDPLGDTLRGVNTSSATTQLNLIHDIYKNDKAVKDLFKLGSDGVTFSAINQKDFDNAILDLDIDKQNGAIALLESINNTATQFVSYVSGTDLPNKDLATVSGLDPRLVSAAASNAPSMSILNTNFGGAMNMSVGSQTLSVINSANSFSPLDMYDDKGNNIPYTIPLGALFFHEVLGHGLGGILKSTNQTHIDAIQLENVYYRAMGLNVQREGSDHPPVATSLSQSVRASVPAFIQGRRLFTIADESNPDFMKIGGTTIEH